MHRKPPSLLASLAKTALKAAIEGYQDAEREKKERAAEEERRQRELGNLSISLLSQNSRKKPPLSIDYSNLTFEAGTGDAERREHAHYYPRNSQGIERDDKLSSERAKRQRKHDDFSRRYLLGSIGSSREGQVQCHVCDGRGQYNSARYGYVQCDRCYGKGTLPAR